MTTPSERVQRLREETAKALGERWFAQGNAELRTATGDDPHWEQIAINGETRLDIRPSFAHIARWDPKAAEKVLDLLQTVFMYHAAHGDCLDMRAALAVLDALDPQEAT